MSTTTLDNSALIVDQGGYWSTILRFSQGRPVSLSAIEGNQATSEVPHCLKPGDCIQITTVSDKCAIHHLYGDVLSIPDDLSFTFSTVSGDTAETFSQATVARTIDVSGIKFVGNIASRSPSEKSGVGLSGCMAAGYNRILLSDTPDIVTGDRITFEAAGITDPATVTGVFSCAVTTSANSATTIDCGCACPATTGGATKTVICVDTSAATTVSCDSPQPVQRLASALAVMDFTVLGDAKYGEIRAAIDPSALTNLNTSDPGCECGDYLRIGCYEIFAYQGYLAPRASYPQSIYASWSRSLFRGPAYMRPSFIVIS